MSGTVLHLGSFKSSWSTGEDGHGNRAECGEGKDSRGPSVQIWPVSGRGSGAVEALEG